MGRLPEHAYSGYPGSLGCPVDHRGRSDTRPKGMKRVDTLSRLRIIIDESSDRENPSPEGVKEVLDSVRTIAVVGISRNPEKAAGRVPSYLASKGYEVIPINPHGDRILGKEARASLLEVTEPVDMVLVFRPSEEAARIVEVAMGRGEKPVIWLQEGIRADEVAARARARGFTVVQDLCTFKAHKALHPK